MFSSYLFNSKGDSMIQKKYIAVVVLLFAAQESTVYGFSMKNLNPFSKKNEEKIVHKEFPLEKDGKLCIQNLNGSIEVKAAWNQKNVMVNAIIRTQTPEDTQSINIVANDAVKNNVQIKTTCENDALKKYNVDYIVIVPHHVALNLTTDNGNIVVNDFQGKIQATTNKGNITINNAHDLVIANTQLAGAINVNHAYGHVKAITTKGNIKISDAHNSIIAHSQKGNIDLQSKTVPSTAKIALTADNGSISLDLPTGVNADVQAHAQKGRVMCQHFITLKPQTLQLTNSTWREMSSHVEGTLGSAEATVNLVASSHIKINETSIRA